MRWFRSRPRLAALLVATALLAATLAFGVVTAASAATFTLNSLSATVGSNGYVTASTSVTSGSTLTAAYFGVCVRSASGSNLDYGKRTNVAFTAGVAQSFTGTKVFAAGTYTYFACLYSGGWVNVGAARTFTVGSVPSPSPTPTSTSAPPPSGIAPSGPPGSWTVTFDDEFNGTALDTTRWGPNWYGEGGRMNGVGTYARNVSESGGTLNLTLESASAGALVHTDVPGGYKLPVGSYAEARIFFPGPSATSLSDWSAWWASSSLADGWPSAGEHDIAEILGGTLTVNYHSPSGAHNQGSVPGFAPGNSWHTYGLYRGAGFADVYWDGALVKHYTTDDNGHPEILILNVGSGANNAYGAANALRVDYVRAWRPAA